MYISGIVLSMNLNLKMTVERSKRRSYFLSLVFITKCSSKNLSLLKIKLLLLLLLLLLYREKKEFAWCFHSLFSLILI